MDPLPSWYYAVWSYLGMLGTGFEGSSQSATGSPGGMTDTLTTAGELRSEVRTVMYYMHFWLIIFSTYDGFIGT